MADDNARSAVSEHSREPRDGGTSGLDEMTKDRKKNKTRGGMLGWLKLKVSSSLPYCVSKCLGGISTRCELILRMILVN